VMRDMRDANPFRRQRPTALWGSYTGAAES